MLTQLIPAQAGQARHGSAQHSAIRLRILPFPPRPAPSLRCSGPVWTVPRDPIFCLNCRSCPFLGVTLGTLELYLLKLERGLEGLGSSLERPPKSLGADPQLQKEGCLLRSGCVILGQVT